MRWVLLIALFALLAGCADDSEGESTETSTTTTTTTEATTALIVERTVSTSGTYPVDPGFDPTTLTVPAGATVNLTFNNNDANSVVDHNWVLLDVGGASTSNLASGESETITFTAPEAPGEYTFACTIGDHQERGMEGTLTVEAEDSMAA